VKPSSLAVIDLLRARFGDPKWPKPFHMIRGALLVIDDGVDIKIAARRVRGLITSMPGPGQVNMWEIKR
jgi:hypothetical protein